MTGSLYAKFEETFRRLPEKIALRTPAARTWTFAELAAEACRYANALEALGIEPGDRVTVQIDKSPANLFLYLAVLGAGGVYQPLNPAYTESETEYFVSDASPKIAVCAPARQRAMRDLGDRHQVQAVMNLDAEGMGSLADLAARMDARHQTVPRAADDLAGLVYTSGTTGRAKGAMITHDNLISNAEALVKLWRLQEGDTLLHALPVFHVHGLFVAINTALMAGAGILWFPKFDAASAMAHLPQATVLMGVPTFYTRLLEQKSFAKETCRNMRVFISGSAPLLAATHREFSTRTGHAILERYGMTETGMITSNPYDGAREAGSVGHALPGVSVRIRGEQPGVVEVKGPNVFKGYWRLPEKTAEDFTEDGYFITGDVGTLADDGRLAIVGRAKDLVISGGFNVYPKEIEVLLDEMEGVVESAVIGVPHPDFGEGVVAVLAVTDACADETVILGFLKHRLAGFKLPKRIFKVGELPRNAMGKVQKAALRERYREIFKTS
ncbi:MAG: AMP-binding protein [Rhizobiales bacterium]|nr:AMP-binding protein [Hyphomicrobiales bacterium]